MCLRISTALHPAALIVSVHTYVSPSTRQTVQASPLLHVLTSQTLLPLHLRRLCLRAAATPLSCLPWLLVWARAHCYPNPPYLIDQARKSSPTCSILASWFDPEPFTTKVVKPRQDKLKTARLERVFAIPAHHNISTHLTGLSVLSIPVHHEQNSSQSAHPY